jgi:tRNA uridine 5-carbamoylmethylation protein Kti12
LQENLKRNKERGEDKFVPENVLEKMLSKLETPESYECETVEYKQI